MPISASLPTARRHRGFTLIELMIAVVVVGILASVAYPSYLQYIRKGRRADAVQALAQLQQAQERWRANNLTYAANGVLTTLWPNGLGQLATSAGGYYTIAIDTGTAPTGTTYTATATAIAGSSQASDTGCTVLTVSVSIGAATNKPAACWSK